MTATAGGILSRFTFAVPIRLQISQSSQEEIAPDLLLGEIETKLVNHQAAIVINIRNPLPRITRYVNTTAHVYLHGSETPFMSQEALEVAFAPNSIFPLALVDTLGAGIGSGSYTAKVMLELDGRTWEFTQDFIIESTQAVATTQRRAEQSPQNISSPPLSQTALTVIIIAGALTLVAITLTIFSCKKVNINKLVEKHERSRLR
jgi:hypothetical protein